MKKIYAIFIFMGLLSGEQNVKKTPQEEVKNQVAHSQKKLILYKDRSIASTPLQLYGDKSQSLIVPSSIDPQSILFHQKNSSVPEYQLSTNNEKAPQTNLFLKALNDFNGNIIYSFSGISWHMHYVVEVNSSFDEVSTFNSFINIDNQSGIDFDNVNVRLINAQTDSFQKNQNFHEYTISKNLTLPYRKVSRIPWVEIHKEPCEQDYRLDVGGDYLKDIGDNEHPIPLQIWIRFKNQGNTNQDLANGNVEVYVHDEEGVPRYLGSSTLNYTKFNDYINIGLPVNLLSQLKSNEDSPLSKIQGTLEQTEFKILVAEKIAEAAYRLTIRNYGTKAASIKVMLPYGKNRGKIIRESMEHKNENPGCVYWPITIQPKSETVLRYRVKLMKE